MALTLLKTGCVLIECAKKIFFVTLWWFDGTYTFVNKSVNFFMPFRLFPTRPKDVTNL
jgi:hypothetical protein